MAKLLLEVPLDHANGNHFMNYCSAVILLSGLLMLALFPMYYSSLSVMCRMVFSIIVSYSCAITEACKAMMLAL